MSLFHRVFLLAGIVGIAAKSNTGIRRDNNYPIHMAQDEQSIMRHLAAGDTEGGYQTMFDGDGMNVYHNIYATAWRYIGFYIDCSNLYSSNNNNNNNHERDLGEEYQDERDLGGGNDNQNQGCGRYLLWAAVRFVLIDSCQLTARWLTITCVCCNRIILLINTHSMLTWAIQEVALENINTTIDSLTPGPTCLATIPAVHTGVQKWIVTCPLRISNFWDITRPLKTPNVNGMDNYSSMRVCVFGMTRIPTNLCKEIKKSGLRNAQAVEPTTTPPCCIMI